MNKILISVLSIMFLHSSLVLAEETMTLRWKFEEGKELHYQFTTKEKAGRTQKIITISKSEEWNEKFLEEFAMPGATEIESNQFDIGLTFRPEDNNIAAVNFNSMSINGQPQSESLGYQFSIDSQGTIIKTGKAGTDSLGGNFFNLPEDAVSIGKTWEAVIPKEKSYLGTEIKIKSTLLGFERVKGYDCVKIKNESYAEETDASNYPPAEKVLGKLVGSGISYFAFKEGKFVKMYFSYKDRLWAGFNPGSEKNVIQSVMSIIKDNETMVELIDYP